MGHHHHHEVGNIRVAFFLNLAFSIIELIGGIMTNSVALLSDALHDIGDSLSLGVAWYLQKVSGRSRDDAYSYGYQRFSVLGAIINAVVLTSGSIFILVESIKRALDPVMPDAMGMVGFAILGVAVNGYAAFRLSKGHSLNEKVVYLHLLEDVLGWTATLVVAIILNFYELPVLDALLSIAIAVFILYNVIRNLGKSIKIILQRTPEDVVPEEVRTKITSLPEIVEVHDCHIWSLDGNYHILSMHVVVNSDYPSSQLAEIKKKIKEITGTLGINHTTLEFELGEEECDSC